MLRITRTNQWEGKVLRYKIVVDGETVGKIKNGETLDFELSHGEHEVYASALNFKSERVQLEYTGRTIHLECSTSAPDSIPKLTEKPAQYAVEEENEPEAKGYVTHGSDSSFAEKDTQLGESEHTAVNQRSTSQSMFVKPPFVGIGVFVIVLLAFQLFQGQGSDIDDTASASKEQTEVSESDTDRPPIDELVSSGELSELHIQNIRLGELSLQDFRCPVISERKIDSLSRIDKECTAFINGGSLRVVLDQSEKEIIAIYYQKSFDASHQGVEDALISEYGEPNRETGGLETTLYWGNAKKPEDSSMSDWRGLELSAGISDCTEAWADCDSGDKQYLDMDLSDFERLATERANGREYYRQQQSDVDL